MIVCKFGGSSVADAVQISKTQAIVKANPDRRIVVVSAPGKRDKEDDKITDLLYKCHNLASNDKDITAVWDKIRNRYLQIAAVLDITSDLKEELITIKSHMMDKCSPDYAASRGEYLNAKLISLYFGFEFLDSAKVIRIGEHGEILPETYDLIKANVDPSKKYVVPGFYGLGPDGNIKTFSRGGSDITGSIYAKALAADIYENWTDVSGTYTCDPRITANARPVPEITYKEMREMAYLGANVFHEEAIAPARQANITINIKNTNAPDESGTFINSQRDSSRDPVVGIAGKRRFRRITIEKYKLEDMHDLHLQLKKELGALGLIISFELKGIDTLNFYVKDENMIDWDDLTSRLKSNLGIEKVSYASDIAIVGIIGEGLAGSFKPLFKILAALTEAGIDIDNLNYGGSPISAVMAIADSSYEKAMDIIASVIA